MNQSLPAVGKKTFHFNQRSFTWLLDFYFTLFTVTSFPFPNGSKKNWDIANTSVQLYFFYFWTIHVIFAVTLQA